MRQRFFVLAADGADPRLLRRFMAEGACPTLTRLAADGVFSALGTTLPAVSPVAWTTFLTGCGPARHGVVDFVIREPRQYRLALGLYQAQAGSPPRYVSRCLQPGLPALLQARGRVGYFLWVPGTFPPEPTHGGSLAGLGVPDALGTLGTSALYAAEAGLGRAGAAADRRLVVPLTPQSEGGWQAPLALPPQPGDPTLHLQAAGGRLRLQVGEAQAELEPGGWSDWLPFTLRGAAAMCRFCWQQREPVELYRTAVQHPPGQTPFALSQPPEFAAQVADWIGAYATLGLAYDGNGLQAGILDREQFAADAWRTWEQRAQALRRLAAQSDWDLAVGHLFTLDAVQHLLWGGSAEDPGPAVRGAYRWLDALAADLAAALDPGVTFCLVSDHGIQPLRARVALNGWLHQHGYLALREGPGGRAAIDWARTQAASIGHSGVFLNVQGREPLGVTPPGDPYEALRRRLAQELLAWRDPDGGQAVVEAVWPREEVGRGPALERLPDLALALQPGYGLDRADMLGQVSPDGPTVQPRRGLWAAGHEGPYRPERVAGTLLAAGPAVRAGAALTRPTLADLAPTFLAGLGLPSPAEMDGQPLKEAFWGNLTNGSDVS
ncbi:MAG: hypothetical protein GX605_02000 [Chloroflexi bacterium]|nr:hypothetical protein [Chloroflexota bacterium]